jgi:hypothetical protein
MARNHIQVMIPEEKLQDKPGVDWMNTASILPAMGIQGTEDVQVLGLVVQQERGCYVLLCAHPGYPEVPEYEEAPLYPYDAPEVVPSGT